MTRRIEVTIRPEIPGPNQFRMLLNLGSGAAGLSVSRRRCEPLLRRGWVTFPGWAYWPWIAICVVDVASRIVAWAT